MSDRPIIFSAPMVRALIAGKKTQTRRVTVQPPPECSINFMLGNESWLPAEKRSPVRRTFEAWSGDLFRNKPEKAMCGSFQIVPRVQPGDRLWVREKWTAKMTHGWTIADARSRMFQEEIIFAADGKRSIDGWWPSIFMPREFSRLTLTVTGVCVERIQDISEEDARAEGIIDGGCLACGQPEPCGCANPTPNARDSFAHLWNGLNAKRGFGWDANPWVVAVSFDVHPGNIDRLKLRAAA